MYNIELTELDRLLEEGREAARYAWGNYEMLSAREKMFTLYGPNTYAIGAGLPGNLVSKSARKLLKKNRRKDFAIYELDDQYKLLRVVHVFDHTRVDCVYHCFELNGAFYAYPFRSTEKAWYKDETVVIHFENEQPTYLGLASRNYLAAEFFEYIGNEKMMMTSITYAPEAKLSYYGYPCDRSVPVGSLSSPAWTGCMEYDVYPIDFARWFEEEKCTK